LKIDDLCEGCFYSSTGEKFIIVEVISFDEDTVNYRDLTGEYDEMETNEFLEEFELEVDLILTTN
jgi:hypothetical protein